MDIDGLIFNQVSGCDSISNIYPLLVELVKNKFEIPSYVVNFNKIGKEIDQTRKQLTSYMEMFK